MTLKVSSGAFSSTVRSCRYMLPHWVLSLYVLLLFVVGVIVLMEPLLLHRSMTPAVCLSMLLVIFSVTIVPMAFHQRLPISVTHKAPCKSRYRIFGPMLKTPTGLRTSMLSSVGMRIVHMNWSTAFHGVRPVSARIVGRWILVPSTAVRSRTAQFWRTPCLK
jgi:hypothetical protein